MNKPLSLNTQLTKLRSVIRLLKGTMPNAVIITESGYQDTSRSCALRDIIYSLRDIQYKLRGLTGYTAKRSAQLRHYTIEEILDLLETESKSSLNATYTENLSCAKIELETVAYYLRDKQNDDLF